MDTPSTSASFASASVCAMAAFALAACSCRKADSERDFPCGGRAIGGVLPELLALLVLPEFIFRHRPLAGTAAHHSQTQDHTTGEYHEESAANDEISSPHAIAAQVCDPLRQAGTKLHDRG